MAIFVLNSIVTAQIPASRISELKINGNNRSRFNNVPVTFKVTFDFSAPRPSAAPIEFSYHLSGDPEMLTGVTSGYLADLDPPARGVYTVGTFDLSTAPTDARGKKVVYLQLANETGVSKIIAAYVSVLQNP